jgi:hypothetical protein
MFHYIRTPHMIQRETNKENKYSRHIYYLLRIQYKRRTGKVAVGSKSFRLLLLGGLVVEK